MVKEAKKTVKQEDSEAAAKAAAEPKAVVIKKVSPTVLGAHGVELIPFKANAVAQFGNNFMIALVAQAGLEEEAQKAMAASTEAKSFLSFEMTKAIFSLAHKSKGSKNEIDVFQIFGEPKDVEKLNNRILIEMGVMKRQVNDDTDAVEYIWTNENVEALYSYTKELKEKDEPAWTRRFNNRKRLNMRLSEACKAASTLMDHKLNPDDLFYSEGVDGQLVPTIRNAPKQIGGDAGIIQMNQRKPVKGATLSPTMSSLVKISTERHKEPSAPRTDAGEKREEEKMGMTDEQFGSIINSTRRAITKQENEFTADMQKQIKALGDLINETMKTWLLKKDVKEAAKEAVA